MISKLAADGLLRAVENHLDVMELVGLTGQLLADGEVHFAHALYRIWIQRNPEHPLLYAIYFNYGIALTHANEDLSAQEALKESITRNPHIFQAYLLLGDILGKMGQKLEAMECWQQALDQLEMLSGVESLNSEQIEFKTLLLQKRDSMMPNTEEMLRQQIENWRPVLNTLRNHNPLDVHPPDWDPEAIRTAQNLAQDLGGR